MLLDNLILTDSILLKLEKVDLLRMKIIKLLGLK